ncbi:MAG: glycosyltransferase family 4 protein [Bacteroidales bacterium]|nr:glycosyltransferase family 4 protein [Bacteroidales bacterium]
MTKICFIVNTIINAGPVNVIYDIVSNIDRNVFEPIIWALKDNVEYRSRVKDFENLGIKVQFFNFSFLKMELQTKKCSNILDNFIEKENIRIVHLHGYHPVLIATHLKSNVKKITTIHNLCYEDYVQKKGFLIGNYMGKRFCNNLKYMDSCVAITEYMKDYYKNYCNRISVIYNGINDQAFSACSNAEKKNLRVKYGFPESVMIYVACNSLNKRKNTIALISAANKLNDNNKLFLIAGDGPEENNLKRAANNNPNIIFLGRQKNVIPILQLSDFYITTSTSEGCPLAPLEAMFCGLTTIYSDISAHKELFYSHKELQPYMFKLDVKDDLYLKIKSSVLIENIQNVANYYRENFSSREMGKKYQELYSLM